VATYVTEPRDAGPATATLIELAGVEKVYRTGKLEYAALRGVDLSIPVGEMVAIVGPSAAANRRSST
jgi:putative ABC transport system ATP-binding protein